MITAEMRAQMRRLVLVDRWRIETVARRFGVHHSTVRRALDDAPAAPDTPFPSAIDPFKPYLVQRLTECPELTASRLFAELRERGFDRSIAIVRRYVAQVRQPRPRKVCLRVEVEPGEQAPVDWGSFGYLRIGSAQRPLSKPERAQATNCVFVGPSGVGKTHLANAIGQLASLRGYRVRFVLAADLVNDLVAAQARNTLHRRLMAWSSPDLLLIDELGYLSFDARGADPLYQVLNRRYQRAATVVTTNLAFKDWGKLFHNTAAA